MIFIHSIWVKLFMAKLCYIIRWVKGGENMTSNDKLIENEEISIPKLIGEYNGCIFRNGKGTFQITLLDGELVKCNIDQEQFDSMVSKLKIGDLVRVVGLYTREPNSKEAKIEDLANIHNINDEFKKTYEEFKKDFEGIPDITEQDIRDLYEIMVQNYSVFLLMGEE